MMTSYTSDWAIHPGEYISEILSSINMSQKELSQRLGRPSQTINEIIKGKKSITPETAIELEGVLKVPSHIWLGLEAEYQNIIAKQKEQEKIQLETKMLPNFPYSDLVKAGFCTNVKTTFEKVMELRKFFSVSNLERIREISVYQPAFRVSTNHNNITQEAIASWIQAGLIKAQNIQTKPFDKASLQKKLTDIKAIIVSNDIKMAISKITEILSSCGVAFVLLPTFKYTKIHGATFWVGKDKAVLAMSLRGAFSDVFWFGFFHEIGHILLHEKRETFLEGNDTLTRQEQEADNFSSSFLIPSKKYKSFINKAIFTSFSVKNFANENGIIPSIVVGRLMHDKLVKFNDYKLSSLRDKYVWAE